MQILLNEPLKNHVHYKIGGNTPKMFIINTISSLKKINDNELSNAYILGEGTNLLVSDLGVDKSVIKINIKELSLDKVHNILTIGAGYNLNILTKELANDGLDGLSHVSGIPGTVGGAIYMNVSASSKSISENLINVEAYNKNTREIKIFSKEECQFNFRSSIFHNNSWIILLVRFQLKVRNKQSLIEIHQKINEYRIKNYPLIFPSVGCWFKRDWGGKDVINKIGMTGSIKGGAVVSPMFPSFILNCNNATAKDIYSLVKEIQNKAKIINEEMLFEVIIWGKI